MTAFIDWLAMGGYAAFVWSAYGLAAVVLGYLSLHCWRQHRRSTADLDRLQQPVGRRR